jgi:serine/threonine-protein kinase HipA
MWKRMTFNALTGNTDDHLRNHGFLRDRTGWHLSPAYDLNPNPKPFSERFHLLPFLPGKHHPSLELCLEVTSYFKVDAHQIDEGLETIKKALERWQEVARQNGLTENEMEQMAGAFEEGSRPAPVSGYADCCNGVAVWVNCRNPKCE